MYWLIKTGGFVGIRHFSSKEEAQEAADRLTAISGRKWIVDCIIIGKVID